MILSRRLRATSLLLTFLLLLAVPFAAARAEEPRSRELRPARLGIAGWLSEAWTLLRRLWEKEGGSIDPFGNPMKEGGSTDPFGSPKPSSVQLPADNGPA